MPFVTPQPSRWLLTLEGGPMEYRLADASGTFAGRAYKSAVVSVQVEGMEADLEQMVASPLSATVVIAPDIDRLGIDPIRGLVGLSAALQIYDAKYNVVRDVMKARIADPEVGTGGDPHVLKLVETFDNDPDFPPIIADTDRLSQLTDSAEGLVYQQVFGSAVGVPCPLIGSSAAREVQYMLCGHGLASTPVVGNDLPHKDYPDRAAFTKNTTNIQWFGDQRVIRDDLVKTTLGKNWVTSGTVSPSTLGVTFGTSAPADGRMLWNAPDWKFHRRISFRWRHSYTDAAARHILFFGWDDTNNYSKVTFDAAADSVRVEAFVAGASIYDETKAATIGTGATNYSVELKDGKLEVKVGAVAPLTLDFGQIDGPTKGLVGWGSTNGRTLMLRLRGPARSVISGDNMNAGIKTIVDSDNHPLVVQTFSGEQDSPIFADFFKAQNIGNAGQLYEALLKGFSDYGLDEIDERTLQQAKVKLQQYGVGSYFNEQQPLMTAVLQGRLGQEFLILVTQQFGQIRTFVIDPLGDPEAELKFGKELLDHAGPALPVLAYTHLKAFAHFHAAVDRWRKKVKLNPQNNQALKGARLDQRQRRELPTLRLADVNSEEDASAILVARASLFYNAADVAYVQEISHMDDDIGRLVAITDAELGYTKKLAVLTAKIPEAENLDFMTCRYRAFDVLPVIG